MARQAEQPRWTVRPHGPLQQLSPQVWRVEGKLNGGMGAPPLHRVMTVARMADGGLLVHSPMALNDDSMAALEALGPIKFIVVPNHFHRLDAPRFAARYPEAQVLCPSGSRKKVQERCRVDGNLEELPKDPHVRFEMLAGMGEVEGVMLVEDDDGLTLVFNDALFNMPHIKGVQGFVLRYVTKSSGGPLVSRLIRWFVLKDKAAFRAHLERLAALPNIQRIVVSHHEVIEHEPARTLREVAATL